MFTNKYRNLQKTINKKQKKNLDKKDLSNLINEIINEKGGDDEEKAPSFGDFLNKSEVKVEQNHIYFYTDVNSRSIYELISAIKTLEYEMQFMKFDLNQVYGFSIEPVIYLHINSGGGYLYDGFLGSDYILQSKVKIVSIIDGYCASSATLLSMCCQERWMNKNSSILIHQLSGGCWGKFYEMEDNFKNSKKAQKKLVKFYQKYTNLNKEEINSWLKKDVEFTSKKCLSMGFVDKVV